MTQIIPPKYKLSDAEFCEHLHEFFQPGLKDEDTRLPLPVFYRDKGIDRAKTLALGQYATVPLRLRARLME